MGYQNVWLIGRTSFVSTQMTTCAFYTSQYPLVTVQDYADYILVIDTGILGLILY